MTDKKSADSVSVVAKKIGAKLKPYAGVFFFLLFAAAYGFTVSRIYSFSNVQLDESKVAEQADSIPSPRIDAKAAKQLEALKDNSVNVQTLFENNRQSPFQE